MARPGREAAPTNVSPPPNGPQDRVTQSPGPQDRITQSPDHINLESDTESIIQVDPGPSRPVRKAKLTAKAKSNALAALAHTEEGRGRGESPATMQAFSKSQKPLPATDQGRNSSATMQASSQYPRPPAFGPQQQTAAPSFPFNTSTWGQAQPQQQPSGFTQQPLIFGQQIPQQPNFAFGLQPNHLPGPHPTPPLMMPSQGQALGPPTFPTQAQQQAFSDLPDDTRAHLAEFFRQAGQPNPFQQSPQYPQSSFPPQFQGQVFNPSFNQPHQAFPQQSFAPQWVPQIQQQPQFGKSHFDCYNLHKGVDRGIIDKVMNDTLPIADIWRLRVMASRDPEGLDQVLRMENGNIRTGPPPSDLKKFKNTPLIYAEVISMYISIKSITLGPRYPTLVPAMLSFVRQILSLEQVYVWQGAVLDLAIAYHQDIVYSGITDVTRWSYIPPDWIALYITPAKLKSTPLLAGPGSGPRGSKRKDPHSTSETSGGPKVPQHLQICWDWNNINHECDDPCPNGRRHECKKCGGAHPMHKCKK